MYKVIKNILLEFQERNLPIPSHRNIHPPNFSIGVRKAWVLMGMRRSGKTWTAYQHILQRQKLGFPKNTNLYINFEDDRLIGFKASDFQTILDVYFELFPQNILSKDLFFCFDEIHIIEGWEKFIRRLIDSECMQICVTGSSAKMLSKELGTSLGGRAWPEEVFPYSLKEFLQLKDINVSVSNPKNESLIKHFTNEYLLYGGFPEVVANAKELHTSLIQGYMDAVILRDIVQRYSIANTYIIQRFLVQILRQLAAPLSVTKVYQSMKSQGLSLGKNHLYDYLEYLEEAYALMTVPFFSFSEKKRNVNPKKIYAIDTGVITAYTLKQEYEYAARLENAVFMHLRRLYREICYYKTEIHKKEVDFVVTTPQNEILLFQVCLDLTEEKTKQREISALVEACEEFELRKGYIITLNQEQEIESNGILINCIPFWKWVLES